MKITLEAARVNAGYKTRRAGAKALGISIPKLEKLERYQQPLKPMELDYMCKIYGVQPKDLRLI